MFTGIIATKSKIIATSAVPIGMRLSIATPWDDVKLGESIAVNGACLTAAAIDGRRIEFDAIPETLAKTNLGSLLAGDEVHLERALQVGSRFDGHFVQGHVDGTALLVARSRGAGDEHRLTLELDSSLAKYVAPKGSVALDGVSLTVASIDGNRFDVALIPTTLEVTSLGDRPIGWRCNFEADMLVKTVVHYLDHRATTSSPSSGAAARGA